MSSNQSILKRFSRLTLWNKIAVWGAIASIIGVVLYFVGNNIQLTSISDSPKAKIYQAKGDINIYENNLSEDNKKSLEKAKESIAVLDTMRRYGDIPILDFNGSKPLGGGIFTSSQLSGWNEGYAVLSKSLENKKWRYKVKTTKGCSEKAKSQFKVTIEEYPNWPFPYYFMAACLRAQSDDQWLEYANKSLALLKDITKVPNHNVDHDIILNETEKLLTKK